MTTIKFSLLLVILISFCCILSSTATFPSSFQKDILCCSTCKKPAVFRTFNDDAMQLKRQLYEIISRRLDPLVTFKLINQYPPEISNYVWETATTFRSLKAQRSPDKINLITDIKTFNEKCADYICLQSDVRLLPIQEYVDKNTFRIDQVFAVPFSNEVEGEQQIDGTDYYCRYDFHLDENDECTDYIDHFGIWYEDPDNKALWDKLEEKFPYKKNKLMAASEAGFLIQKWQQTLPIQLTDIYYKCSVMMCLNSC